MKIEVKQLDPKDFTPTTDVGKILKRLKRGSVTNSELNRICFRYSARIADLRKEGYDIYSGIVMGSLWEFKLIGTPFDVKVRVK